MNRALWITIILLLTGCEDTIFNNPYPMEDPHANTFYTAFVERPKHLDPARSYSSGEWTFIAQIYEPPLQYDYWKRPYSLVPCVCQTLPKVEYVDSLGIALPSHAKEADIAETIYTITVMPDIYYQPHPAFAKNEQGDFLYHSLPEEILESKRNLQDFPREGTRELEATDFVLQIKRLALPKVQSPILGLMQDHIVGLKKLNEKLEAEKTSEKDLRFIPFEGAKALDKYRYQIRVKGKYPQFIYWLAMPFFAPMPYEALIFYNQQGMEEHNITLDWYPVGTGPYRLVENNPERRMVLTKNPNFREDFFPKKIGGVDKNQPLPLINKIVFSLEKETIPYWNKFLQGYYDNSGISSDSFDQAIEMTPEGGLELSEKLKAQGITLYKSNAPTIMYWGFNMLDSTVGGYSESNKKLRQALSMAFDVEEFISIFLNGRGIPAQGPIAPQIFGFEEGLAGINPVLYKIQEKQMVKKSIEKAKILLEEAGYPSGIDPKTHKPLTLYFDTMASGDPDEKFIHAWLVKQFKKLGIELVIRTTDYNRFQDKMQQGTSQLYFWGWNADYPDPENFLFLFYGPNGKVANNGENASNYQNREFDKLFEQMRSLENGEQRKILINKMVHLLREDSPWIFGYHPQSFTMSHQWVSPFEINHLARNTMKYMKISPDLRVKKQRLWNKVIYWPILIVLFMLLFIVLPAFFSFWKKRYSVRDVRKKVKL